MAAYAQSPTPADDALALARTLARVDKNGPKAQELKDDYPNRQLQNRLMDRLLDRNDEDLDALFVVARRHGLANIDLFTAYRKLENSDQNNIKDSANYKLLIVASSAKDWIRANRALGFLALYHAKQKDSLPALRFANAALGKIPVNSYNLQIGDARYDTYDVLNTVFIYDRNLTKAVDAAKNMVQYGLQAERDIDRIGVIYNLSVLFAYARDYTTATKLSEMLVNMGSSLSQYENALANLGHGKNLVYQEKYKSALPFLKKARDLSPETIIGVSAKAKLALVYANLGKTNRALGLLREMESVSQQKPAYRERLRPMIDQVYARVYQTKGNYKRAFRYQEKWANAEIAKLENLAFEDRRKASEQLALSEKLARTEFKSLRTKTRLQAEVIVQEKRFRKALTGLLVALLIIILMLIAARIKLKKVNAELEIAAELAKAGEKAKATFLAVMSHELRTPMNPIIALSNVLKNRIADPEDAKLLALINSSAEGLMDMIENIMAATEDADDKKVKFLETVELRPFLTELVKRFYEDACHKNLNFEMRYNPKLPDTIMTNKIGLKLLTNNILSNAVKFTESGTISVMVTIDPHRAETVLIVVKDTGVGLEMSELPNLLKAFEQRDSSFTRKFGGTGIGLYVAALKAKQIGADLDFQSVQGKGTQVEIRVPFTQTLDQIDEGSDTLTQAA